MPPPVKKKIFLFLSLCLLSLGIHLLSNSPKSVEFHYTNQIYPYISSTLRKVFGILPFSAGDLLYVSLILSLIWKITRLIRRYRKEKRFRLFTLPLFLSLCNYSLIIYILFNFLWGLNYNRLGIQSQMNFSRGPYSLNELVEINELLLEKVNQSKDTIISQKLTYLPKQDLFKKAGEVYKEAAVKYPFLHYSPVSVKPSLFNLLGNYFGFSGYYNPFTGEAQVNTDVPVFLQPYITSHEIAHQLGYAKENEANFAGFIAATSSDDPLFRYSAFFDLFLYANRALHKTDSTVARGISDQLRPAAKEDLNALKAYYKKYENPVEPLFTWIYGKYLVMNDQPLGMVTYSEVVADLIAWYRKSGKPGG